MICKNDGRPTGNREAHLKVSNQSWRLQPWILQEAFESRLPDEHCRDHRGSYRGETKVPIGPTHIDAADLSEILPSGWSRRWAAKPGLNQVNAIRLMQEHLK